MRRTAGTGYLKASSQALNVLGSGASVNKDAIALGTSLEVKDLAYVELFYGRLSMN